MVRLHLNRGLYSRLTEKPMGKKKPQKKQPKLRQDEKGQFRWETSFVGGKQKRQKTRMVDGMNAEEFVRLNADDIWLKQEGYFEALNERETGLQKPVENGVVDEAASD